ncbi:Dibasic-processing endoprotease [Colletotrichum sp. SAR 10_98]|nr:Dibasic-processing endoprotease [Colletotrichum sp. SAR 10_98]
MAEERDEGKVPESEPPRGRARSRDIPQPEPPRQTEDGQSATVDNTEPDNEVASGNNPKSSPPRPFSPALSSNTHDDTFDSSVFDSPAPFDDSVNHSPVGSIPSSPMVDVATPETKQPRPLSWASVVQSVPEESKVKSDRNDAQRDAATERQTLARLRGRLKSLAEEHNLLDLVGTLLSDEDSEDSSDESTMDSLLNDTFAKLASEVGHRSEAIASVKAELEEFKRSQAALQQEKKSLEEAVKEKDVLLAQVNEQLTDVREELEDAKVARDANYDDAEHYNSRYEEAENNLGKAEDKLAEAESRICELTIQRDRADAQRRHLQSRVEELERDQQTARVAGTEELELKVASLSNQLREEQTTRAKAVKDLEQKERKWKSSEDGYNESINHYEQMLEAAGKDKVRLNDDIDRLKQELDESRRKRAAAKPESATFLVDGEKVSYKQYEKMLSNTRGEVSSLKQQLDQVQDEQRLSQEIPVEDVRRIVEPFLKVYGIAFETALLAIGSSSQEEEDSIDALANDDGTSTAFGGAHDLRSELQGLSFSRESSVGFEEPEVSHAPQSGMLSKPCSPTVVADLRARLLQAMTKLRTLEDAKQVYETQILELRDKVSGLRGRIDVYETIIKQLKADISQAKDRQGAGAEQRKLAEHEATISALFEKLQVFKEKLSEANQHRNRLQEEIEDTRAELEAWQVSGDEVGKANLGLEERITEQEDEIAILEGRIEKLKSQLDESIARNEEVESERFDLETKLAGERYKRQAETERRTQAERGAIWEGTAGKELRRYQDEIEQLKQELFNCENDLRQKEREIAHAKRDALQAPEKQHSVQTVGTQTDVGQGEVVRVLGSYLQSLREFAEFEEKLASLLEESAREESPKPNDQTTDMTQPSDESQPLSMDPWDEQIGMLDQLEEMREVFEKLRKKKDEHWKSLTEAQNGELYLLDLELGTLEERLQAVEADRGLPTDTSEDLSLEMAIKQGEKEEIMHPITIESAALRKDIKTYGARLNDSLRRLDQPPPTPPLQATASTLAPEHAGGPGERQLIPRSATANRENEGRPSSHPDSENNDRHDKGDGLKDSSDAKPEELSSRPYFVAEIDAIRSALERLDTSANRSLQASRVVRAIQLHAAHSLELHIANNDLVLLSFDGDSEPPYDLSTNASDSGGTSVFDPPTQDPGEIAARLGSAFQEFNNQISQIPKANHDIIRAIHSLVRRAGSVQNYDFLRTQARNFALQRDQALRILENRGADLPMFKEHEQKYQEDIKRLEGVIESLRAQLSDRERDKEMVESLGTQLANLKAEDQTMPLQLRQTEEKLEEALYEKNFIVREHALEILQVAEDLRRKLEESQEEVDSLQKKLDLELSSRSAPIDHLIERRRELEQQLAVAKRAKDAAEESHLHVRLRLQKLLNGTGENDGERMRRVISHILDPTGGSNEDADPDSVDASDDNEGTDRRFDLEQKVQELQKVLELRQGRDDQLQQTLDDREKLLKHVQKEFELSQDNRIAGAEKCKMLEQQIKELQATNEVLHVNFAALDDRPASRLSGTSGGDIADSPTFRKGSRKLKKVIYVDGKAQVVTVPAKGDEDDPKNEPERGENDTDDKIIEDLKKQNEHLKQANEKLEEDTGTTLEVLEGSQSKSSQDVKKWKEKGSDKKKKKKGKEKAKPRLKTASKDEDPEASSSSSSSDSDSSRKDDDNGGGEPSQSPEDRIKQLQEQNRLLKKSYFEAKQKAEDMEKDMDAMEAETPARAAGGSNDNSNKPGQKPQDKTEDKPEDKPARMNPRNKPNRNNSKPNAEGTAGTGPPPKSDPEFVFRYSEDMMFPLPASAIQKEDGKAPGDGDRDNKSPGDGNGRNGATEEVKDPWVFRVIMSIFKWYWLQVYNMCDIVVRALQFKAIHHRNFAFLLVGVVWNVTFYFCLCNWFALHVSRELWARGNDLTRAYYIETTVRPKVHNMLGLGGADYRFWPTVNYFAGLFYENLLGISLSWNTSGLPWEARMAGEEGVFPVFLED